MMNRDTLRGASREMGHPSKKLIAAYVFDWVIIVVFAAAGGFLSFVHPTHRAFSLLNTEISYPYVEESIPAWLVGVIAGLAPALIIAVVALVFVPGREVRRFSTRSQVLRLKLWELEKGLAGLCLSLAVAFFVTQGMKNMFGKPRPNMLARCNPNVEEVSSAYRGGYGQDISMRWTMVDSSICQETDEETLQDAFRSFPSGHASWSWGGLLYLTLFICSKFGIGLPHLPVVFSTTEQRQSPTNEHELLPLHANRARGSSMETERKDAEDSPGEYAAPHALHQHNRSLDNNNFTANTSYSNANRNNYVTSTSSNPLSVRNAAAAPPNYLILPALTPIAVAVYICSTRFAEYYHFGFDLIFGSLIGIVTSWLAFRWYHLPISRGQGWAWGARSRDRAFAFGVGTSGWVSDAGWSSKRASPADVSANPVPV
ncbi:hypothetical protein CKM354_000374500 [Cercospora kikuchii]|uniref:Phosphatidic acid phosphatase type 2/haloperoxidase domain-containing protein n=1 Tax=Cercospora kikuchii TaxID=84275 RepID=A0A9P3CL06_9PEZI|nr:uncharacterized protein CKM354_000374500 [Cercospora kikuchii]GIZ40408.1 hypothetical protein CKM354_000374500 [Cercospora kikuchii]